MIQHATSINIFLYKSLCTYISNTVMYTVRNRSLKIVSKKIKLLIITNYIIGVEIIVYVQNGKIQKLLESVSIFTMNTDESSI